MEIPMITEEQYDKIKKFFPLPRRDPIIDNKTFISCSIWVIKDNGHWKEIPEKYGNFDSICKKFSRWSKLGIFRKIFAAFSKECGKDNVTMVDSTFSKVHRTACSLKSDGKPREIGKSKGGYTTKIHMLATINGKPLDFHLTGGQVNDSKEGTILIEENLGRMKSLLADKAYDTNKIRDMLSVNDINCCIPPKSNRKIQFGHDKELYRERHKIENMFGKLKDWLGIAFRRCRCAHIFDSFVCIALVMIFFNVR